MELRTKLKYSTMASYNINFIGLQSNKCMKTDRKTIRKLRKIRAKECFALVSKKIVLEDISRVPKMTDGF